MKIVYGDIVKVKTEAIVNAANTTLQHGGGVAAAIVAAGGRIIQQESDKIGHCPIGSAVTTTAGKLNFKFIIHIPTIDWQTGEKASLEEIYNGTVAALKICQERQIQSVAFPLLGAGVVGLPNKQVKQQIENAAKLFPEIEVILVLRRKSF